MQWSSVGTLHVYSVLWSPKRLTGLCSTSLVRLLSDLPNGSEIHVGDEISPFNHSVYIMSLCSCSKHFVPRCRSWLATTKGMYFIVTFSSYSLTPKSSSISYSRISRVQSLRKLIILFPIRSCDTWYKIAGALSVLGRSAILGLTSLPGTLLPS